MLHHESIRGEAPPRRWLVILHGIYGSGRNWAGIARELVKRRSDWGVVLVDLRGHGGSTGMGGPHSLAAAAGDVKQLIEAMGLGEHAVLGHSFGGKVALSYGRDPAPGLVQVWVIDSTPAKKARSGPAWEVLAVLRRLPARFDSREAAVAAMQREGLTAGLAGWMAMNLRREDGGGGGGVTWRIDLEEMGRMLEDFAETELWDVVEAKRTDVHFVKATRSDLLSDDVVRRIGEAAMVHEVEGGHWINADNPAAIAAVLARFLPEG